MRSGLLKHRVTFQRSTVTQNDLGEPVDTWADITTAWARIESLAGKERFAAMQTQADVDHQIVCRYQSLLDDLEPDDRITWNGRYYDIKAVINPDERNRELRIFAQRHFLPVINASEQMYFVNGDPMTFVNGDPWYSV